MNAPICEKHGCAKVIKPTIRSGRPYTISFCLACCTEAARRRNFLKYGPVDQRCKKCGSIKVRNPHWRGYRCQDCYRKRALAFARMKIEESIPEYEKFIRESDEKWDAAFQKLVDPYYYTNPHHRQRMSPIARLS